MLNYYPNYQIMDCSDKIILPIFINLHIHLGETLFRPLPKKMSLLEYISYTEEQNKNNKDIVDKLWQKSANITVKESLDNGVPIICTLRGNDILSDYNMVAFCGYPIMLSEKLIHIYQEGFKAFKNYCKNCKKNIIPGVFLHSLYYNNKDSFHFSIKCFKYIKSFYAIHVAEDKSSEDLVQKNWGKRSIDILKENKLLNKRTIIIHGNTLNDNELNLIAQNKANISICPISAKNLNTSILNLKKLESLNINWSISSDGLASGESANLLLQTNELINKIDNLQLLLKAITINPQKALGLKNEILSQNSFANFIIIDKVKFKNTNDLLNLILTNNIKIKSVYFKGKKL